MFDIGGTVKHGVARAAERGVSVVTVHGDSEIVKAAVEDPAIHQARFWRSGC
jgi:orotidine-5'-phosphate decarboxylase